MAAQTTDGQTIQPLTPTNTDSWVSIYYYTYALVLAQSDRCSEALPLTQTILDAFRSNEYRRIQRPICPEFLCKEHWHCLSTGYFSDTLERPQPHESEPPPDAVLSTPDIQSVSPVCPGNPHPRRSLVYLRGWIRASSAILLTPPPPPRGPLIPWFWKEKPNFRPATWTSPLPLTSRQPPRAVQAIRRSGPNWPASRPIPPACFPTMPTA